MSNLKLVYQWWANLGKPEKNEQVTGLPLFFATLIILLLTWLPIHFHAWYLCAFLIGEYKENFEYWRVLLKPKD